VSTERSGRIKRLLAAADSRSPAPHRPALGTSVLVALLAMAAVLAFVIFYSIANRHTTGPTATTTTTTSSPRPVTSPGTSVSASTLSGTYRPLDSPTWAAPLVSSSSATSCSRWAVSHHESCSALARRKKSWMSNSTVKPMPPKTCWAMAVTSR